MAQPDLVPRVQPWSVFKGQLLTAAAGGAPPPDAGGMVVESLNALMRLLTPGNRELLRIIRDEQPPSVAALARRTNRAEPNLARTLGKLEAAGLVTFRREDKRRVPVSLAQAFRVEIDPYGPHDRIEAV
jgi:predicted transcriptional regulator